MYGYDGDGYGGMGDGWTVPDITMIPGMSLAKEYSEKLAKEVVGMFSSDPMPSEQPEMHQSVPRAQAPMLDPADPFQETKKPLPSWVIPVGVGAAALVIGLLILRARSKR